MAIVMACDACARVRTVPEDVWLARVARTEARAHCRASGHTVWLGDGAAIVKYELLAGVVLVERWSCAYAA